MDITYFLTGGTNLAVRKQAGNPAGIGEAFLQDYAICNQLEEKGNTFGVTLS